MVERNLLREGFVTNTRTPLGTISGSQVATSAEIDRLADGDITTVALTASGTKFICLDADLGARFKIDRLELYTAETSASNFYMFVSDDGAVFSQVTMTGSPGLYISEIDRFALTTSGAPRYVRYEHRPSVNTTVAEWKIVSDQTLIDFGADGLLTELEVTDAPIGRPSDHVATLTLLNNFEHDAEGFVFIDRTNNDAEAQIEIALEPAGPWFGKFSSTTSQPSVLGWETGNFSNTRVIPSGVFLQNFADGDMKGWSSTSASLSIVGGNLRGSSTTLSPRVYLVDTFVPLDINVFYNTQYDLFKDYVTFRAADADRVKVRFKVLSSISTSNFVEGIKLYWRTQDEEAGGVDFFRESLSTFPIGGSRPPTGSIDSAIFDVGSVPTWSGTIRSLGVRPFVVATGTGLLFDILDVEAYHTDGDRIALDFRPVSSGTFPDTNSNDPNKLTIDATPLDDSVLRTFLSTRHTIMQDSIITGVRWFAKGANTGPSDWIFLARPVPTSAFPATGTNFSVPYAIRLGEDTADASFREFPVFWSARKGDILGAAFNPSAGTGFTGTTYVSLISGTLGDSYHSTTGVGGTTLENVATTLNGIGNWIKSNRHFLIGYDAQPNDTVRKDGTTPYYPTGTYQTPVLDAGLSPALAQLVFTETEPAGTSVDSLGADGFDTVRARASALPPRNSLGLGEFGDIPSLNTATMFTHLNDAAALSLLQESAYQINTRNGDVSTKQSVGTINNFGGAVMYHALYDELWVVNCMISGTNPVNQNDVRPSWDRFDAATGDYLGTQKVNGSIFYSYEYSSALSSEIEGFEPAGMVADYGRNEMYIFSREDSFFVGTGAYYGIVTDLAGNFKDVFWRTDGVLAPNANRYNTVIGFTYAPDLQVPELQVVSSGIFFTLNNNVAPSVGSINSNKGILITAYRNGQDSDLREVTFINEKTISSIPGLGWAANPPDARGIAYNTQTGTINLLFDSTTSTNSTARKDGLFVTLRPSFNESSEVFEYAVVGSGSLSSLASRQVEGYRRENAGDTTDWIGSALRFARTGGNNTGTGFTTGMAYNPTRDTFVILRTYMSERTDNFPIGDPSTGEFYGENHSFLAEVGAGSYVTYGAGRRPYDNDAIWGTLSGIVPFQDISTEGFNFPPGRYVQVEYQLNSDVNGHLTPYVNTSTLSQGLRIGKVPAGGTTNIYVRTNIPADQPTGDQVGALKVYWETVE